MILLNFQTFILVRKKHSTIFAYSDLKCPFIKNFHQHTLPLKLFHLEFYIIVQYYFHPHFQQVTQVCFQVAQVFMSQMFLVHLYQQLYQYSEQKHHCPPEWLLLYPIATCSYSSFPVTKQCLQPLSFSQFCSIYDELARLHKLPSLTYSNIHLLKVAHVFTVSCNIFLLPGTLLEVA